jgi:hypothetical protein
MLTIAVFLAKIGAQRCWDAPTDTPARHERPRSAREDQVRWDSVGRSTRASAVSCVLLLLLRRLYQIEMGGPASP